MQPSHRLINITILHMVRFLYTKYQLHKSKESKDIVSPTFHQSPHIQDENGNNSIINGSIKKQKSFYLWTDCHPISFLELFAQVSWKSMGWPIAECDIEPLIEHWAFPGKVSLYMFLMEIIQKGQQWDNEFYLWRKTNWTIGNNVQINCALTLPNKLFTLISWLTMLNFYFSANTQVHLLLALLA